MQISWFAEATLLVWICMMTKKFVRKLRQSETAFSNTIWGQNFVNSLTQTKNISGLRQNYNVIKILHCTCERALLHVLRYSAKSPTLRLRSHRHQYQSEYPYTGSKKHEFACISMAAVHIDTSSVRVRVTCEFHSYEQFLCRSCFYPTRMKWTTQNLY